jgi:hypothetical protein
MVKMSLLRRASWLVWVGMLAGGVAAHAQGSCTFTDETGKTVTWPNCQPPATSAATGDKPAAPSDPAASPAAAKGFPFPGDPAPPPPANGNGAGQTPAPPTPASKAFPFPGDNAGSPATPGGATPASPSGSGLGDAGSSGSSSSSSSSSSNSGLPDDPPGGPLADDDPAAKAAAARKANRQRLATPKDQTLDQRKAEDLDVAAFYMNDLNFRGAYLRAADAVSIDADDPEAHFALAEAARKLGKLDEALTNYKKCLTLDPVPKTRHAAEKAVKEMSGG